MTGENMDCRRFRSLIDGFLDEELTGSEREAMLAHAAECPGCAALLAEHMQLHDDLNALDDDLRVPEEVTAAWQSAVDQEAKQKTKRWWNGSWTRVVAGAAAMAVLMLGVNGIREAGKGSSPYYQPGYYASGASFDSGAGDRTLMGMSNGSSAVYYDYDMEEAAAEMPAETYMLKSTALESDGTATEELSAAHSAVIIRSAGRTMQSKNFEEDAAAIDALVARYGGWNEYRGVSGQSYKDGGSGRSLNATVRVPSESLDAFLKDLSGIGSTLRSSDNAEDISDRYYDTAGRLASLKAQYDRLNDLIAEAADLSELLQLEDKMYDVQYRIDQYEGTIRGWDSQVNYSEVTLDLREVREYTEPEYPEKTFGQRIAEAFTGAFEWLGQALQDTAVGFIGLIPVLLIPAAVVIVAVVLIRRRIRAKKG